MNQQFYKGAQGNLSLHLSSVVGLSLAAGASHTLDENLPIGVQVTGVRVINDALGANTELTVQLVDHAGNATDLAAVSTVSADATVTPTKQFYIGDQGLSDLVIKNTGTGAAAGDVTVQLEYRFKGY